tara:strand:- start:15188 stop:15595 length:408 start_codon:yes stop_codon:yes gene_type:complete
MEQIINELKDKSNEERIIYLLDVIEDKESTISSLNKEIKKLEEKHKNKPFFNKPKHQSILELKERQHTLNKQLKEVVNNEKRYNQKFYKIDNDDINGLQRKIAIKKALVSIKNKKEDLINEINSIKVKISSYIIF